MADELPEYKAWLQRRPCQCGCGAPAPSVVHHSTAVQPGMGRRAHDRHGISMAERCHRDFHSSAGRWKLVPKIDRRRWQNRCVLANWEAYAREGHDLGVVMGTTPPPQDDLDDIF